MKATRPCCNYELVRKGSTTLVVKGSDFLYIRITNSDPSINGQYSQLSLIPVTDKYFWLVLPVNHCVIDVFWGAWAHIPPRYFLPCYGIITNHMIWLVDKLDNFTSWYIDDRKQHCKYNDDKAIAVDTVERNNRQCAVFYHGDHGKFCLLNSEFVLQSTTCLQIR